MAQAFQIAGEVLVSYNGSELGLANDSIHIRPNWRHQDVIVDAWGPDIPADVQAFLMDATITMTLVYFDQSVLSQAESNAGAGGGEGVCPHAGTLMGANSFYKTLQLSCPNIAGFTFPNAYLMGPAIDFPIGSQRSLVSCTFRAVPYNADPYNGGLGASGQIVWSRS